MIGYISGKIKYISENSITLGEPIGYTVNTAVENYSINDQVELFTYMAVRENEISLWGFKTEKELGIFKLLINISGVGPRIAQTLIYNIGIQTIISSVINDRASGLKSTGIGLKTAQKIVLELKGKFNLEDYDELGSELEKVEHSLADEALMALVTLGYREGDLSPIISKILKENPNVNSSEEIIKLALRSI